MLKAGTLEVWSVMYHNFFIFNRKWWIKFLIPVATCGMYGLQVGRSTGLQLGRCQQLLGGARTTVTVWPPYECSLHTLCSLAYTHFFWAGHHGKCVTSVWAMVASPKMFIPSSPQLLKKQQECALDLFVFFLVQVLINSVLDWIAVQKIAEANQQREFNYLQMKLFLHAFIHGMCAIFSLWRVGM